MQNNIILASLRIEKKLTQKELASLLKVSLSTYKLYEFGTIPMKLEEINTLSNIFHVSFDYLLGFSKNKQLILINKNIDYPYLRFCIRYLRKKERISQKKLAKEFDISAYSISKYERQPKAINLNYLTKMAKKFQISTDYICGKSLKKEVH